MATENVAQNSKAPEIIDLTIDDSDDHPTTLYNPRPLKRQRTDEPSPRELGALKPSPPQQRQQQQQQQHPPFQSIELALQQCLETQVFPHIERATKSLDPKIYDLDELGARAVKRIVDQDFQRHFRQNNGCLAASKESVIAAGIHRIVTELLSGSVRKYCDSSQTSSPAPFEECALGTAIASNTAIARIPVSVPIHLQPAARASAVLPSIEKDVAGKDGSNYSNNQFDIDEHIGFDEDEEDESEQYDDDGDEEEDEDENEFQDNGGMIYQSNDDGYGENNSNPSVDATGANRSYNTGKQPSLDVGTEKSVPLPRTYTHRRHRLPKAPKVEKKPISSQQLRTRAKANQWQSGKPYVSPPSAIKDHRLFGLASRPYVSAPVRQQVLSGAKKAFWPILPSGRQFSNIFHVDLNNNEISYLQYVARSIYGKPAIDGTRTTLRDLRNVLKKLPGIRDKLAESHAEGYVGYKQPPLSLMKRSSDDIVSFLNDLYTKRLNTVPQYLSIENRDSVAQSETGRARQIPALLLSREIIGRRLEAGRTYQNFITTVKSNREDYLEPQIEWTNCAGDIMTVSWLSNADFICGTTTHSDTHNQQYNKPGNLLLGSAATNTLRAYPDHRITRPIVSSGDNSLASMVASQDPWLFTSVVSSDYDPSYDLAFTSSFDKTVKVWQPEHRSMRAVGTWEHKGHVNFVVASKNGAGTVATAADVPTEAVRVYHLDRLNISGSPYDSYSCTRIHDEDYVPSEDWAYYPAAIRWGRGADVRHLLLIGYSPRSPTGEDHKIPEEKLDTGDLCLWNTITKEQVKVNSAKTQNVFEVAWHPSRSSFAAATSASNALEKMDQIPRTQIRIFELNAESNQYGAVKTLDCAAIDINELTIMPNCLLYSYVTASCTDGRVYVWDTAGSDLPMCVLEHGDPVEELLGEREREDVGVKFTAWATTADRLYTGSSDGVLKVWNIRHGGILVKELVEVAAPITYGEFSPDFTRLVVGDASGRVYLFALEDPEEEDPEPSPSTSAGYLNVPTHGGGTRPVRRPRPFIPHAEIPPPSLPTIHQRPDNLMEGQEIAREYLRNDQLVLHTDPTVGAVQGTNYATTHLFRNEAHMNGDFSEPLLASFQNRQQDQQRQEIQAYHREVKLLRQPERIDANGFDHPMSVELYDDDDGETKPDHLDAIDHATWLELKEERAELDDPLIELDYETSIADSDDDDDDEKKNEDIIIDQPGWIAENTHLPNCLSF